jgi:hypothetical protein
MTPFEQELGLKMSPGEAFVETSFAVPAHDHLVIEFITAGQWASGRAPRCYSDYGQAAFPHPALPMPWCCSHKARFARGTSTLRASW